MINTQKRKNIFGDLSGFMIYECLASHTNQSIKAMYSNVFYCTCDEMSKERTDSRRLPLDPV